MNMKSPTEILQALKRGPTDVVGLDNPGDPVDLGVKLTVTPTVNTASNITVRIEPELTRFLSDAVAPNGQTYPIHREEDHLDGLCAG
jgi:Flp pilus assembly secretin CpaC